MPPRYVPLRLGAWFARQGITNVVEMDWWQRVQHPGTPVSIVMTPAQVATIDTFSPLAGQH